MDLEGHLESAEILKCAKTDAGCYETWKNQTTVVVGSKIESKCDSGSKAAVDNGANVDLIAAMSRTCSTKIQN